MVEQIVLNIDETLLTTFGPTIVGILAVGIAAIKSKSWYTSGKEFIEDVASVLTEAAELLTKLSESLADDTITTEELEALKTEAEELVEELQGLIPYATGVWKVLRRG